MSHVKPTYKTAAGKPVVASNGIRPAASCILLSSILLMTFNIVIMSHLLFHGIHAQSAGSAASRRELLLGSSALAAAVAVSTLLQAAPAAAEDAPFRSVIDDTPDTPEPSTSTPAEAPAPTPAAPAPPQQAASGSANRVTTPVGIASPWTTASLPTIYS